MTSVKLIWSLHVSMCKKTSLIALTDKNTKLRTKYWQNKVIVINNQRYNKTWKQCYFSKDFTQKNSKCEESCP